MEEKLREIIRESRKKLLSSDNLNQYDLFSTLCILKANDFEGTSFSLQILCFGVDTSEKNEYLTLCDEVFPITVEKFNSFMKNCCIKYDNQIRMLLTDFCYLFYGISEEPTVENVIAIINYFIKEKDCSILQNEGIGFGIYDRTF